MKSTIRNIVIIDDSNYKCKIISDYMKDIIPDAKQFMFKYMNKGLLFLYDNARRDILNDPNNWLIITDMYIPPYEDHVIIRDAGCRILREMQRLRFKCPVIVQSSEPFESLSSTEIKNLYNNYLGSVLEDASVHNGFMYEKLLKDYITY